MLKVLLLPFLSGGCQVLCQGNQRPSHLAESYVTLPLTPHGCLRTTSNPRQEKAGRDKKNRSLKFRRLLRRGAHRSPAPGCQGGLGGEQERGRQRRPPAMPAAAALRGELRRRGPCSYTDRTAPRPHHHLGASQPSFCGGFVD